MAIQRFSSCRESLTRHKNAPLIFSSLVYRSCGWATQYMEGKSLWLATPDYSNSMLTAVAIGQNSLQIALIYISSDSQITPLRRGQIPRCLKILAHSLVASENLKNRVADTLIHIEQQKEMLGDSLNVPSFLIWSIVTVTIYLQSFKVVQLAMFQKRLSC